MDIFLANASELSTEATTNAGKFNLAVNQFIPNEGQRAASRVVAGEVCYTCYIGMQDTSWAAGTKVAGNNSATVEVKPKYFPVATKGAECGALVSTLDWADVNLSDYEYIQLGATSFFVTGVLNSSQTQANDPFDASDSPGIVSACCWNGGYAEGLNPF